MNRPSKVLIVDDAAVNRAILANMLESKYEIIEAQDGQEAIRLLETNKDDILLILLDLIMPVADGFTVLEYMNERSFIDTIPVIIISSDTSEETMNAAYSKGASEYITRPFNENIVNHRVDNTILMYSKKNALEEMVVEQMKANEESHEMMVHILSHIVEFRNGESGKHVLNIKTYTLMLLTKLKFIQNKYHLTEKNILLIANASALHDIGKISIDGQILNKPGRLTPEEFEIIKTHSAIGAEMIEKVPFYQNHPMMKYARDICRWHHERYDGRGYPDGLVGDQIPISAQVVSLADVYDALTSERVYKAAYSHEKAVEMILNGECGRFNPLLLDCFLQLGPELAKVKQEV